MQGKNHLVSRIVFWFEKTHGRLAFQELSSKLKPYLRSLILIIAKMKTKTGNLNCRHFAACYLICTSPSRVETIRVWVKPAHSFCRGVLVNFHNANVCANADAINRNKFHLLAIAFSLVMHEPVQRKRNENYFFHDSTVETKLASYITSGLTTDEKLSESVRNLIYSDI